MQQGLLQPLLLHTLPRRYTIPQCKFHAWKILYSSSCMHTQLVWRIWLHPGTVQAPLDAVWNSNRTRPLQHKQTQPLQQTAFAKCVRSLQQH